MLFDSPQNPGDGRPGLLDLERQDGQGVVQRPRGTSQGPHQDFEGIILTPHLQYQEYVFSPQICRKHLHLGRVTINSSLYSIFIRDMHCVHGNWITFWVA